MSARGLFPSPVPPDESAPAAARAATASQRAARWAAAVSLAPIPLWFIASALLAPAPAWRAEYRERPDFTGAGAVVRERELQRYWDKSHSSVPGGLSYKGFVARWDACLRLREAREVPFLLAADGSASFALDGVERLRAQSSGAMRATRGDVVRLERGTHHLHVELVPRGWPSVALLASFDGAVPRALGSGELAPGVEALPAIEGSGACPDGD